MGKGEISQNRKLNLTSNPNPTKANRGWMEFDVRLSCVRQLNLTSWATSMSQPDLSLKKVTTKILQLNCLRNG